MSVVNQGESFKIAREQAGLSQGQAAEYGGTSQGYLSNVERGTRWPSTWKLIGQLAKLYKVSTDYLLGLTHDPTPAERASEIQVLFNRLPSERQNDLLQMAETWLLDASEEFQFEWLERVIAEAEERGRLDEVNALFDEARARAEGEDSEDN